MLEIFNYILLIRILCIARSERLFMDVLNLVIARVVRSTLFIYCMRWSA